MAKRSKNAKKKAYKEVDKRDGELCRHPGCWRSAEEHHHIEFVSVAKDREGCIENIVSLCQEHHHGDKGPHKSSYWREYWKTWQKQMYSYYMSKDEQNEMERLCLMRFVNQDVLYRLDELEERWRIWQEKKIDI
ncbi:MAG: hypothetical protein AB7E31_04315 [Desulfitobacterium sp.]